MSLATELIPEFEIPERARTRVPERLASVTVLHPPAQPCAPSSIRLTRRGVVVLTVAVLALGVALVWFAKQSAPQSGAAPRTPHAVVVQPGDTLWAIADRVAPQTDPRAEVAALQRRNHLHGVDLVPGEVLRVP